MQLVISYKEKVTTTSLKVAEKFGIDHKKVVQSIINLECSPEFHDKNFEILFNEEDDVIGEMVYIITRDGFTMLMMSLSSPGASKFREEFIAEFNRMEEILRQNRPPVLLATYQKRILSEPTKKVPKGYWSVFDECHKIMLFIEKHIGSVSQYDLIDGSIGRRWCAYRKDKQWATDCSTYPHEFNDIRGAQQSKCYKFSEIEYFREWLHEVYRHQYLYDYLHDKYTKEKNRLMLDKVEQLLPRLLKAS